MTLAFSSTSVLEVALEHVDDARRALQHFVGKQPAFARKVARHLQLAADIGADLGDRVAVRRPFRAAAPARCRACRPSAGGGSLPCAGNNRAGWACSSPPPRRSGRSSRRGIRARENTSSAASRITSCFSRWMRVCGRARAPWPASAHAGLCAGADSSQHFRLDRRHGSANIFPTGQISGNTRRAVKCQSTDQINE